MQCVSCPLVPCAGRILQRLMCDFTAAGSPRFAHLTWGVSGQAHSFAPAAGVSPAKRGEAQRSRERSDLDAPAAGYTVTSERALARSWLPLWSLPRSFILALRISFGVWIRSVSPSFACSLDGRITSHPVELVGARTIIPHARGRRARVGGTILLNGVFQPGKAAVTARPDPAKPSRSASLEWG